MAESIPPENLPDGWEYQEDSYTVICGGCCFRFGAEHPNSAVIGPDTWTCPCCGDGNAAPPLTSAERAP